MHSIEPAQHSVLPLGPSGLAPTAVQLVVGADETRSASHSVCEAAQR
jgi:hypothetical protein